MDNKKIFFLSGFLSLIIYILLFLSIIFYFLKNQEIIKKFSIKKQGLSVSLVDMQKIEPKKIHKKSIRKKHTINSLTKKKKGSISPKEKGEDINKLFSKVKVSKKIDKKVIKKSRTIPSRFKGEGEKRELAKDILQKLNIKDASKISDKKGIEPVEGENDPYWSKVYEILYENWMPSEDSAGNMAKVKIFIDQDGNFDYKVLLFSDSEIFNQELLEYLNYLKSKKFPPPKEKKDIIIIFKAKG